MELSEKLRILVDKFCEDNSDVVEVTETFKIIVRLLTNEAAIIAWDHWQEMIKTMKKDNMQ